MIPTHLRENLRLTDWDSFKETLAHTNTPELQGQPTTDINTFLEAWYDDINTSRKQGTGQYHNTNKTTLSALSPRNITFTPSRRYVDGTKS